LNNSQIEAKKIVNLQVVNPFGLDFTISTKNQEK